MILPDLNYCIILWGSCASYLFQKVFVLQKKVVRIITNSSYNAHTDTLFVKLKILKLEYIYELSVTSFMFLYSKNALPNCFNDYFVSNNTINTNNIGFPAQFQNLIIQFNIKSIQIHDSCDHRGDLSLKFVFLSFECVICATNSSNESPELK